jgi:hypothetical protein
MRLEVKVLVKSYNAVYPARGDTASSAKFAQNLRRKVTVYLLNLVQDGDKVVGAGLGRRCQYLV